MGTKIIFSQKLCAFLMSKGFVLLEMKKDLKNPRHNIYIFNNSDELQKCIYEYSALKNS